MLLREKHAVPGVGDALGVRCALPEPRPSLQRCAGLSPDANLDSARAVCDRSEVPVDRFDKALEMFNQVNQTISAS